MYAAHFAAGLAIKGNAPRVSAWPLLLGVFVPDFVWVAMGLAGVEPSQGPRFFDDWSHSLVMVILWATLFAVCFWSKGRAVMVPLWLAVVSHFFLDLPIHPKNMALFPHSSLHLGWNSWGFGQTAYWLGITKYWWIQLAVMLVLSAIYVLGAMRNRFPRNLVAASCIAVVGLHLMSLA